MGEWLSVENVVALVSVVSAVLSAAWGASTKFRARRYEDGFEQAAKALYSVAAAVELAPDGARKKDLKNLIRYVAEHADAERATLSRVVREVEALVAGETPERTGETVRVMSVSPERISERRKKKTGFTGSKGLFFVLVFAAMMVSGCSLMATEFVDIDGTRYAATVWAAPFSDISGNDARMAYDWDGAGGGKVGVGQGADRIDQTAQGPAMDAMTGAIVRAYLMSHTGGLSGLASGGGAGPDVRAPVDDQAPYDALGYLRSIPEADARAIWRAYRAGIEEVGVE